MTNYIIKKCSTFSALLYFVSLLMSFNFHCYEEPIFQVAFFFGNILCGFNYALKYKSDNWIKN